VIGVGGVLSGGELGVEGVDVGDAPVEALSGEGGEFDLGDVEPGAVAGRVVDLQPLRQRERRGGVEGLAERADAWVLRLSMTSTTVSASG
jgi:hypothetical protein